MLRSLNKRVTPRTRLPLALGLRRIRALYFGRFARYPDLNRGTRTLSGRLPSGRARQPSRIPPPHAEAVVYSHKQLEELATGNFRSGTGARFRRT